jgi:hypothetical protein
VPLQIWSEDARAAEVTPDGVVRFVRQSRSPATFLVERLEIRFATEKL